MKKLNLLSRAEMKNVMGGYVMSVQMLYETCLSNYGITSEPTTPEEAIAWGWCDNEAQNACSSGQARGAICDYENWTGSIE